MTVIPKLIAPGTKQIIQIIVGTKCDLACSNCTQHIAHQTNRWWMTPENFRAAVRSLADWNGVIGVFGGNPCLHPQFEELCRIFVEEIPDRNRRGLWSNNVNGHGAICEKTFGYFNLVVHGKDDKAIEMEQEIPKEKVHGKGPDLAWHGAILTAVKDMVPDEAEQWKMIAKCDINLYWSGAVTQTLSGGIGAYFCEVAASFDNLYGEDHSIPCSPGWWRQGIEAFEGQVRRWCTSCGIPLKLKGHRDLEYIDDISATHAERISQTPSVARGKRLVVLHDSVVGKERVRETTDYMRLRK